MAKKQTIKSISEETPIITEIVAETVAEKTVGEAMKSELQNWANLDKEKKDELDKKFNREVEKLGYYLTERAETTFKHNEEFRKKVKGPANTGRDYLYTFMYHWAGWYGDKIVAPYQQSIDNYNKAKSHHKMQEGGAVNKFTDYYIIVNLDERGEYSADVYDPNDKIIYNIETELLHDLQQDGFLKYKPDEDLHGLTRHLIRIGFIPNGSQVYSQEEWENKIRDTYSRGGIIKSLMERKTIKEMFI